MDSATPDMITKHSISSTGDLHDATPVLASERRQTSSSDVTAAGDGLAGTGSMVRREKQDVRDVGTPAATGPGPSSAPPSGPPFKKFGHKFSDPALAPIRKVAFKIIIIYLALLTIMMWLALPLYWGSFWKASIHSENLTVMILNRDSSSPTSLGSAIVTAGISNRNGSSTNGSLVGRLGFFEGDTADYPDEASVINAVVEQKWWGVVVVNTDATAQLQAARQSGNTTYDPRSAIGFYYAQGRMENAINGYLVPITSALLVQTTERWSAQSIAGYLASIAGNTTAVQALAAAPRTVTPAVSYTSYNLRPFSSPVATAVTLVGQIYMLIIRISLLLVFDAYFTFVFAMAFNAVREIIGPKLTLRSYLTFRLVVPVVAYAWLSLNLAMINLPFKLPFDAKFTYAGGFFLWWMVLYAGMLAVGLAIEFCIVLLTPRFVAFALLPLIIVQVSVVSLPYELQPRLYRYGVATPFYRVSNAVRTIIFNTKNQIGLDFGILLAWAVLSVITISALTTLFRRQEEKKDRAQHERKAEGNA